MNRTRRPEGMGVCDPDYAVTEDRWTTADNKPECCHSPIRDALDDQASAIKALHAVVDDLYQRLDPVLGPLKVDDRPACICAGGCCELDEMIRDRTQHVREAIEKLTRLERRLQL